MAKLTIHRKIWRGDDVTQYEVLFPGGDEAAFITNPAGGDPQRTPEWRVTRTKDKDDRDQPWGAPSYKTAEEALVAIQQEYDARLPRG